MKRLKKNRPLKQANRKAKSNFLLYPETSEVLKTSEVFLFAFNQVVKMPLFSYAVDAVLIEPDFLVIVI
jgi:hypothetical protein